MPTKQFSRADKFASIEAFEAALLKRGGLVTATPDLTVRAHFLAACSTAAFLNAALESKSRLHIDAAFTVLSDHLKSTSDELNPENWVRWSRFFTVKTRTISLNQERFLQCNPELRGSALTSASTAYDSLMYAFGQDAVNWILARKESQFGLPHAAALLCADVMFGEAASLDALGDMQVSKIMVEMITKIIAT